MDRSTRQKINKETLARNDALNQMDVIDIYSTFHPKATEYTFFSSAYRTFSKIDHILGYKSNLSNFKKIESISSTFSDHNTIRLENNSKKKTCKKRKHVETQQHATKQPRDHWRNQRGNLKIPSSKWQRRYDTPKPMECSKSHSKRKVYSNTSPPQEQEKVK